MTSRRFLRRALLAAACGLAAIPAAASADSIVFVKDANVWLAHADGSGAYQVTPAAPPTPRTACPCSPTTARSSPPTTTRSSACARTAR